MGLFGMAMAGLGGAAQGYEQGMVRHDAENKDLREKQWDLLKEQRIEEAKINEEGRAYATRKQEREDEFGFNTNPKNVEIANKIAADKARSEYAVKDEHFGTELEQLKQKEAVTDHTDYAGRSAAHELVALHVAKAKQELADHDQDFTAKDKSLIGSYQSILKSSETSLKDETLTDAERTDIRAEISNSMAAINAILGKYADTMGASIADPEKAKIDSALKGKGSAEESPLPGSIKKPENNVPPGIFGQEANSFSRAGVKNRQAASYGRGYFKNQEDKNLEEEKENIRKRKAILQAGAPYR
jgi:hypothetical protein